MTGPSLASLLRRPIQLPRNNRTEVWPLVGLLAVVFVLFGGAVFGKGVFFERDIHMMWYGQVESFVRAIAAGSWPVWDPYIAFGQPLWANANNQVLYPPTWLNLFVRPWTYYTFFVVAHFLFSAAGLRLLALRFGCSPAGAFVAAALWAASGPFVSLVSLWNHLAGAAWIPWIFLAADVALESGRASRAFLWGAAMAAQVLAGSPDLFALTGFGVTLYALTRARGQWGLRPMLGAWTVALALSAGQWLPSLEVVTHSARWSLPVEARTAWSLSPWVLLEVPFRFHWNDLPLLPDHVATVLEHRAPWLRSVFLGIPALGLVAAAFCPSSRRSRFLGALAVACLLVALGHHSPAYDLASFLLPPLRILRFPVKAMILVAFSCSLLAGMGFDAWRRQDPPRRRWLLAVALPLLALCTLSLAGALLAHFGARRVGPSLLVHDPGLPSYAEMLGPTARRLAFGTSLGLAALLTAVARSRSAVPVPWPAVATAALAVADLLAAHHALNPLGPKAIFTHRPEALDAIERTGYPRLYVDDYAVARGSGPRHGLPANPYRLARVPEGWNSLQALSLGVGMYLNPPTAGRWGCFGSYDADLLDLHPTPQRELTEFVREVGDTGDPAVHRRLLEVGSVSHALALHQRPWWRELTPAATRPGLFEEPIRVFKVPKPLPRAYAVGGVRVADGRKAIEILADPGFDPSREVILADGAPKDGVTFSGTGTILDYRPDRVRLEADLPQPGYVVLVDAYDPGWRASVDGLETPVLRANVAFRAVRAPAGHHVIEFNYRPRTVVVGALVSTVTLIAGLGLMVREGGSL